MSSLLSLCAHSGMNCCFSIYRLCNSMLNRFLSKHLLYIAVCIMHYISVYVSI